MTGYRVFKFLWRIVDGKHLMRFESEATVFKSFSVVWTKNINISKRFVINLFNINSVWNSKHDLLPTMQGFELETKLEIQNNTFFSDILLKKIFPKQK